MCDLPGEVIDFAGDFCNKEKVEIPPEIIDDPTKHPDYIDFCSLFDPWDSMTENQEDSLIPNIQVEEAPKCKKKKNVFNFIIVINPCGSPVTGHKAIALGYFKLNNTDPKAWKSMREQRSRKGNLKNIAEAGRLSYQVGVDMFSPLTIETIDKYAKALDIQIYVFEKKLFQSRYKATLYHKTEYKPRQIFLELKTNDDYQSYNLITNIELYIGKKKFKNFKKENKIEM
jgi:hypothetical protein